MYVHGSAMDAPRLSAAPDIHKTVKSEGPFGGQCNAMNNLDEGDLERVRMLLLFKTHRPVTESQMEGIEMSE